MKRRRRAVRRQLKSKGLDALVVTSPANVTYLSGFSGSDSWAVITRRALYLLTDSRYIEQAEAECTGCRIIQRTGSLAAAVLLMRQKSVKTVAVENTVSIAEFRRLSRKFNRRLKAVADTVENIRICKDTGEIAAVKKASLLAGRALRSSTCYVKPGITESELAGIVNLEVRRLSAVNSFDTIVAFGANGSRAHHKPTSRKLKSNDTVLIDFGVRYKGYCCDITRCFSVGRVSSFYRHVYNVVLTAQRTAIELIRPGIRISRIDAAAKDVISRNNLPVYGHGTGHGLGLEVHEYPVISERAAGRLQTGQIITVEPAVYLPGRFGIRIEDDILVTADGFRVLSSSFPPPDEVKSMQK